MQTDQPETKPENAPDYLKGYVRSLTPGGPSDLLINGKWCGHGEKLYRVYDIEEELNSIFTVNLPNNDTEEIVPLAVKLNSAQSKKSFLVYDTRQHPASFYSFPDYAIKTTNFKEDYCCQNCNNTHFKLSVGLEIPEDFESFNDVSWFILAGECINCGCTGILFEDETA